MPLLVHLVRGPEALFADKIEVVVPEFAGFGLDVLLSAHFDQNVLGEQFRLSLVPFGSGHVVELLGESVVEMSAH